jgi:hypothetical protein
VLVPGRPSLLLAEDGYCEAIQSLRLINRSDQYI